MRTRDAVLGVLVALAWGLNFVAIGAGLRDLPAALFVGLRFLFTAVPLVFFVRPPDVRVAVTVGLGVLTGVGQFGLLFLGVAAGMPAGLSSVVVQAQLPFTVLIAAAVLGERPTRRQVAGLAVAVAGLLVIGLHRGAGVPVLAVLLVVGAGASWAGANVLARSARSRRPFSLLVHSSLVSAVCMLALSLVFDGPGRDWRAVQRIGPGGVASLLYIVVVATLGGYGAWYWLLGRYDSSSVAAFPLLAPVAALSSAWLVLGETVGAVQLIGSALVVGGVADAIRTSRNRAPTGAGSRQGPRTSPGLPRAPARPRPVP